MEEWRDIKGYKGFYQVSSTGRVRSLDRVIDCGDAKRFVKGKTTTIIERNNYKRVALCRRNKREFVYVHRLVAFAFIEKPKKKDMVNHINGIKSDNRVKNLEWCTCSENIRHYLDSNPDKKLNWRTMTTAKLDDCKILTAFTFKGSMTQKNISGAMGLDRRVIQKLFSGETYRDVSVAIL